MRKNQIIIVLLILLNIIGLIIPYSVKNYKLSKNINNVYNLLSGDVTMYCSVYKEH